APPGRESAPNKGRWARRLQRLSKLRKAAASQIRGQTIEEAWADDWSAISDLPLPRCSSKRVHTRGPILILPWHLSGFQQLAVGLARSVFLGLGFLQGLRYEFSSLGSFVGIVLAQLFSRVELAIVQILVHDLTEIIERVSLGFLVCARLMAGV